MFWSTAHGRWRWLEGGLRHSCQDGYHVSKSKNRKLRSKDDVAATSVSLLNKMDVHSCRHSYGGAVITEAGTDSSVAGLVYIAAHMPDAGENEADDGSASQVTSAVWRDKEDRRRFHVPRSAQFHVYFAADLPAGQAAFMAQSQVLNFADNSKQPSPQLRGKQASWALVAAADRTITPISNAGTPREPIAIKSKSPEPVTPSTFPDRKVAALIEEAASHAR